MYRLILVNNETAALFQSAYLTQIQKEDNLKNILLFCPIEYQENYTQNPGPKVRKILSKLDSLFPQKNLKKLTYPADKYSFFSFRVQNLFINLTERKRRKKNFGEIKELFKNNSIELKLISEVWYSNAANRGMFFYLLPKAKGICFEHGLSDVRNAILYEPKEKDQSLLRFLKTKIRLKIETILVYYNTHLFRFDQVVSILHDEILATGTKNPLVQKLEVSYVKKTIDSTLPTHTAHEISNLPGKSALILFLNIKPWTKDRSDNLKFFHEFELYIMQKWSEEFKANDIKNLIFKSRFFHEEHADEGIKEFSLLRQNFNVIHLTNLSEQNYSSELYLNCLKPKIMMGSYSSGLFYAQKICEDLQTFTFDDWYIEYCLKNFGKTFDDFDWLYDFFAKKHYEAFKLIAPKRIVE